MKISRKTRLAKLGYEMVRGYKCPIRKQRMPYATTPINTGATCVFNTLEEVDQYIAQVEQMRSWEKEIIEKFNTEQ